MFYTYIMPRYTHVDKVVIKISMQKRVTFYAKITSIATYVTFCTFCKCCDYLSSKRKYAWCKTCTDDRHTQNSTLNVCLAPFERETTGSTLKCAVTSVYLSTCSFHWNVKLMLFFGSWQTTLRSRYVKVLYWHCKWTK